MRKSRVGHGGDVLRQSRGKINVHYFPKFCRSLPLGGGGCDTHCALVVWTNTRISHFSTFFCHERPSTEYRKSCERQIRNAGTPNWPAPAQPPSLTPAMVSRRPSSILRVAYHGGSWSLSPHSHLLYFESPTSWGSPKRSRPMNAALRLCAPRRADQAIRSSCQKTCRPGLSQRHVGSLLWILVQTQNGCFNLKNLNQVGLLVGHSPDNENVHVRYNTLLKDG